MCSWRLLNRSTKLKICRVRLHIAYDLLDVGLDVLYLAVLFRVERGLLLNFVLLLLVVFVFAHIIFG